MWGIRVWGERERIIKGKIPSISILFATVLAWNAAKLLVEVAAAGPLSNSPVSAADGNCDFVRNSMQYPAGFASEYALPSKVGGCRAAWSAGIHRWALEKWNNSVA